MMHGLLEVDVTGAKARLKSHKAATSESLSFTAFLAVCLAKAVDEHKAVQAMRKGSKCLVLFEDVDIYLPIEHEMVGQKQVIPHIIRAANRKTLREIHDEIRAVQARGIPKEAMKFMPLPGLLFKPYFWFFGWRGSRNPQLWKKVAGTVGITAVGMFGNGSGWGIPIPPPTALMLTVGGIGEKLAVVDGNIVIREYLSLTLSFDHDIIDGAPAARFTRSLKDLIEDGYGLDVLFHQSNEKDEVNR
jgi:pyruvate/2-oxoglutarate dehydrogenase complex dihydrolipoamide acyltransferase (E2) component